MPFAPDIVIPKIDIAAAREVRKSRIRHARAPASTERSMQATYLSSRAREETAVRHAGADIAPTGVLRNLRSGAALIRRRGPSQRRSYPRQPPESGRHERSPPGAEQSPCAVFPADRC